MELLRMLGKIRIPGLNEIMMGITYLGDETAFLVIALVIFWCVSKKLAYYVLSVGFIGTIANQFMKLMFRIPRPWILDPDFQIVEQARASAAGYSFPSGHTQNAVGTFGSIAYASKNRWVQGICIAAAILIPFSRMYLGVHTPWDVGTAALIALMLVFLLRPLIYREDGNRTVTYLLLVMTVIGVAFLLFTELYAFPGNIDMDNLNSGRENAYTLLGAILGFLVAHFADNRWIHFSTKAVWWVQIFKTVCGLIVVLAVKTVLKAPLTFLFGIYAERIVRYFLVVVVAGALWPMTFGWFQKLGTKTRKGIIQGENQR